MALKATVIRRSPFALLVLDGVLDEESVRVLRMKAQSLLATDHPHVVVDLTDVVVEPVGAEMLAYVLRIFHIAGGTVAFRGCELDLEAELLELESTLDRAA